MLVGRLGIAAAVVAFGTGSLLALYEVQGNKMPDALAFGLTIILVAMALIAGAVVVYEVVPFVLRIWRLLAWRWPVSIRQNPLLDPNQWLLDIAHEDLSNPTRHLLILNKYIANRDFRPTTRKPWIEFAVELYNGGVHTVIVGPARGAATYNSDTLVDPIEGEKGRSSKPRGHSHPYKLKQFVPTDVAAVLYKELDARQAIRSMGLNDIEIEVTAQVEGAPTVWLSLRNHDVYRERD